MELLWVNEYYANTFVSRKLAYYYGPGHLVYVEDSEQEKIGEQIDESTES